MKISRLFENRFDEKQKILCVCEKPRRNPEYIEAERKPERGANRKGERLRGTETKTMTGVAVKNAERAPCVVTYTNFHRANLNMHESEKVGPGCKSGMRQSEGEEAGCFAGDLVNPARKAQVARVAGCGWSWETRLMEGEEEEEDESKSPGLPCAVISSPSECRRRIGIPGEIVERISAGNAEEIDVSGCVLVQAAEPVHANRYD